MRSDGKRVTNVDPMYTLAPYFMRTRNDAMNMITVDIPYDLVHQYVLDLRKRGFRVSHMAVIIAAYTRMICDYPALNRFIVNSKIYARNDFTVGMVVLRPGESDPSMSKMKFDLGATIFEINDIINEYVEANNKTDSNNGSDNLFRTLVSCGPLMRFGLAVIRGLDNIGLLPKAITDLSPFHNSLVFTNLASIRTNDIYHHAYNFGTVSIVISMGNLQDRAVRGKDGVELKRVMPLGIVMDERIASGHAYALCFERIQQLIKHPEELERRPEVIKTDFEFEGLSERFKSEKTKAKEKKLAEKKAAKEKKRAEKAAK